MSKIPNLDHVKSYFDKRIQEHGASPRGSDWNSETSQNIRLCMEPEPRRAAWKGQPST